MSEQDLWIAVLQRQIDDALIMPAGIDNRSEARRAAIRDARRFLTTPSRDLDIICTLAGLDPEAVMDRMRAKIANAPTPEQMLGVEVNQPRARVRRLSAFGETHSLLDWSRKLGLTYGALHNRIKNGWDIEDALTAPVKDRGVKRKRKVMQAIEVQSDKGPGVGSDFAGSEGTGGGRSAQDSQKISFSNQRIEA